MVHRLFISPPTTNTTPCCNITPDYQIILTIIIYYIYKHSSKDCIKQACVKCCNISTCQPHILAKLENQRKQSILDGTDSITTAANLKRSSKVKDNGSFVEGNIHYFGDTVVLWNVIDFMNNGKWIDDAVRRCVKNRQRFKSNGVGDGGDGSLVVGSKRKRDSGMDGDCKQQQKTKKLSRKQRFKAMFG